jgi:hypothetical protein
MIEKVAGTLRVMIASSSDSNYYPLLSELFCSLKKHLQDSTNIQYSYGVVDAGIGPADLQQLDDQGIIIREMSDALSIPGFKLRGRKYLLSTFVRAYLPEYYPGYDIYIWMDADSWICNKEVIELYIKGAQKERIALVCGADRANKQVTNISKWIGPWATIKHFYMKNARGAGLSWKEAQTLSIKPTLLSGNFALKNNAPHWKNYQSNIEKIIKRGRIFGSDQLALGMTVYLDNLPAELLPAWCNWTGTPMLDEDENKFVEPYLPHHPIGIIHMAGRDAMRADRSVTIPVKTTKGNVVDLSLRYGFLD